MQRLPPPPLPSWIERQLPAEAVRYRLGAGPYAVHVTEMGSGRSVLLLHGNPTWGFLYRRVMAALAGEPFRLVVPDLVGLGFSDRPRHASEHTLLNHARWLGGAIDTLDLADMLLVLHDWGGPIGLRAMADRPGRASGLVVLNTVVGPPRPGFRPTAFHRLAHVPLLSTVLFRAFAFPQCLLGRTQGDPRSIAGHVARAYRYPLRGFSRNAAPLALARMAPDSLDHPSVEPLRRCQSFVEGFAGPSAIVWGDRDPILGRVRSRIEKLLPQAEVTRTGAGHFLQEEVPDEIVAAIRRVAAAL